MCEYTDYREGCRHRALYSLGEPPFGSGSAAASADDLGFEAAAVSMRCAATHIGKNICGHTAFHSLYESHVGSGSGVVSADDPGLSEAAAGSMRIVTTHSIRKDVCHHSETHD